MDSHAICRKYRSLAGKGTPLKMEANARRKIKIKPLKKTNLGLAAKGDTIQLSEVTRGLFLP